MLSQFLQPGYARRLLADQPAGLGYLLKQRITDTANLTDGLHRITHHECVIDPAIVDQILQPHHDHSPLTRLTARERQILTAIAEGRSNSGVAIRLHLSQRTVESVTADLFRKLDLAPDPDSNRRVLAVLALLHGPRPRDQ